MTKRDNFEAIANILDGIEGTDEHIAFIHREINLLDKRASAPRKLTADQLANEALKQSIVDALTDVQPATATEIAALFAISVQKASQLLRQLVLKDAVIRIEGKGKEKTRFTVG